MKKIKIFFYEELDINLINLCNNELINFYDHKNENFNGIVLFHDKNLSTIDKGLRDELDYDN
jgi:hypothetical protein